MAPQPTLLLRLVFLLSVAAALVSPKALAQVDSYTRIDAISNTLIDEAAKFAVAAYNWRTGKALVFVREVTFEHQVLPRGVNYKLVVEAATPAGVTNVYKAVVHEEERKLTFVSFVPVLKN
ncbi:hypothetical protein Taro_044968 [Colocasia esculenta]|uniref:Cystatin domain-containing protein n=1 Tax=Colocasia esculenta TaxID=4460 RepID=A0A843WKP3_COLES|nr:hypothetical protein [Colocasia esculenta]